MSRHMKLTVLLILALALLGGCAQAPAEPTQTTAAPEPTVPTTVETVPVEQAAPYGTFGMAARVDGSSYYWDYDAKALLRRDSDGSDTTILSDTAPGKFAIANGTLFYSIENTLHSISLTDSTHAEYGKGIAEAVDPTGEYLICRADGVLNRVDTQSGSVSELVRDAYFLALHNGVVYYTPVLNNYSEAEQKGKVTLCAVNADGTDDRIICVTEPDLYDFISGYSAASVMQLRFSDDALYFSYGSIAGTGFFFQGGKVVRVGFDGSGMQVVAGEDALVDADFVVLENGSVATTTESYYVDYSSGLEFIVRDRILYWFEPLTGEPIHIADADSLTAGVACDTWEVSYAHVSDGFAYYRVLYKVEDPENSFGWRTAYKTLGSATFVKDLSTGETVTLVGIE